MAASSSSSPSFVSRSQTSTAPLSEIQEASARPFKEALSVLLKLSSKSSPPSENRLKKLRLVDSAIADTIPSDYTSDRLKRTIFIFKESYLQKNATPEILQRSMSGYPIQAVQDLGDTRDYHRQQEGSFWDYVVEDLFPGISIDLQCTVAWIVKHRELLIDLSLHHTIYLSEDQQKLTSLILKLTQNFLNGALNENKIYIFIVLNAKEKELSREAQYSALTTKRNFLAKLVLHYSEKLQNEAILSLFTFVCLLEISPQISLIAYGKSEELLNKINTSGIYTPTMFELQEETSCKFIHSPDFVKTPLPTPLPTPLTIEDFLRSPAYRSFTHLASQFKPDSINNLSIVPILASANSQMIEKLVQSVLIKEKNIHEELRFVVSETLQRIQILLHKSVINENNLSKFYILHELLAEEILLLLHLLRPYKEGDLQLIFSALPSTMRFEIAPSIRAFSSGIAALNAPLRTLTHMIGRPLKIIYTKNCYYETKYTPSFQPAKNETESDVNTRICCLKSDGWELTLEQKLHENFFPDVVLLSIRSLPTPSGPKYTPIEKISSFLELLLTHRPQDSHLTVFLDITNDELHSDELIGLVNSFTTSIQEESLSFVLFRSGHKFLQLGVDKVNIGYAELHTRKHDLANEFAKLQGTLSKLDYQALCHFLSCAHHEIHHYTKLHQLNSRYLSDYLNTLTNDPAATSGLKLMKNDDPKAYYVQLNAVTSIPWTPEEPLEFMDPAIDLKVSVMNSIFRLATQEGIPLQLRDSFGFNETVVSEIGYTWRFSVGTHSLDEMKRLCEIFRRCHETIRDFNPVNPKKRIFREGEVADEESRKKATVRTERDGYAARSEDDTLISTETPPLPQPTEVSQPQPLKPFTQLIKKLDQL